MRLNEVVYTDALPVEGYGSEFFRIGGATHQAPLTIMPTGIASWAGFDDPAPIVALSGQIDVCLVGTGREISHVPESFRAAVESAGIGIEFMASPQACRTYNVLLGEGRRIGLALMPVGELND